MNVEIDTKGSYYILTVVNPCGETLEDGTIVGFCLGCGLRRVQWRPSVVDHKVMLPNWACLAFIVIYRFLRRFSYETRSASSQ